MKIIHVGKDSLSGEIDGEIVFSDFLGSILTFKNSNHVCTERYTYKRSIAKIQYRESIYELYFDDTNWTKHNNVPFARCVTPTDDLSIHPEAIKRLFLFAKMYQTEKGSLLLLEPDDFPETNGSFKHQVIIFSEEFNSFEVVSPNVSFPNYIDTRLGLYLELGFETTTRLTKDFEAQWVLSYQRKDITPSGLHYHFGRKKFSSENFANVLVLNTSSYHVHRMKIEQGFIDDTDEIGDIEVPDHYREKGRLVGLDIEKPELLWERVFDYQVDDIASVMGDRVLVTSERYLFILNPANGEIEREWDSGIRDSDKVETGSNTLLSVGDTVFLFSYLDRRIQIYDAKTMTLQRTIDGNEAGYAFGAGRTRVYGKRVLVPVDLVYQPFGGGAFLVIDLDNLDAELEVEQGPELQITEPTPENPGPIVCEVDYPDWGKALRFAERELVNRVVFKSGIDERKYYKPRVVKLIYSGYEADKALVQEKLEIFKQRFEKMIDEPLVPGIALPPVTVEYELA